MNRWTANEGSPFPFGVSWVEEGQAYNFALYSRYATGVTLLLYSEQDVVHPVSRYQMSYLINKTGRIWHCRIPGTAMNSARYYAYSIEGPEPQGRFEWHNFDPEKIILDPYARSVFFPATFDRDAATQPGPNVGKAPLGLICKRDPEFNQSGDRRPRHESDLIIYELHVRGFTNNPNSRVSPEKCGTYAGLVEKIPYLKALGITAVELMPVFQYDPQEGNYWGYMPLNFFSPHQGYATRQAACACEQHNEFRAMVKALHAADLEVILDVVYNHTAEGNHTGPIYSFKGIDNSTYYLISDRPGDPYQNFSGTGNTLNCANRYVRKMILDSMRYWVREMHVDGFRFDLASCGWEGDIGAPPEVIERRKRQIKNFCCLLFLANGTPMFCAGDEFLNTQRGNNNPYNQDNETTWLNWELLERNRDIFRFFQQMIAFRKTHPSLSRSRFWREEVRWYGTGSQVDWSDDSHTLAFYLSGASQGDDDIYAMINAYRHDLQFTIQEGQTSDWHRVVDTSLACPSDFSEPGAEPPLSTLVYTVKARSVVILLRKRKAPVRA